MEGLFYLSACLSACAILISLISLAWSIHIGRRDRGKLKATSKLYRSDSGVPYLQVKAVNHGRRPVILTMLGADFPGGWGGIYLEKGTFRLGENEAFEETVRAGDHYTMSHEGEEAIDLWFEDTLCRRYRVKNAKEHLKELWDKGKKN